MDIVWKKVAKIICFQFLIFLAAEKIEEGLHSEEFYLPFLWFCIQKQNLSCSFFHLTLLDEDGI